MDSPHPHSYNCWDFVYVHKVLLKSEEKVKKDDTWNKGESF